MLFSQLLRVLVFGFSSRMQSYKHHKKPFKSGEICNYLALCHPFLKDNTSLKTITKVAPARILDTLVQEAFELLYLSMLSFKCQRILIQNKANLNTKFHYNVIIRKKCEIPGSRIKILDYQLAIKSKALNFLKSGRQILGITIFFT